MYIKLLFWYGKLPLLFQITDAFQIVSQEIDLMWRISKVSTGPRGVQCQLLFASYDLRVSTTKARLIVSAMGRVLRWLKKTLIILSVLLDLLLDSLFFTGSGKTWSILVSESISQNIQAILVLKWDKGNHVESFIQSHRGHNGPKIFQK